MNPLLVLLVSGPSEPDPVVAICLPLIFFFCRYLFTTTTLLFFAYLSFAASRTCCYCGVSPRAAHLSPSTSDLYLFWAIPPAATPFILTLSPQAVCYLIPTRPNSRRSTANTYLPGLPPSHHVLRTGLRACRTLHSLSHICNAISLEHGKPVYEHYFVTFVRVWDVVAYVLLVTFYGITAIFLLPGHTPTCYHRRDNTRGTLSLWFAYYFAGFIYHRRNNCARDNVFFRVSHVIAFQRANNAFIVLASFASFIVLRAVLGYRRRQNRRQYFLDVARQPRYMLRGSGRTWRFCYIV